MTKTILFLGSAVPTDGWEIMGSNEFTRKWQRTMGTKLTPLNDMVLKLTLNLLQNLMIAFYYDINLSLFFSSTWL